MIFQEGYTIGLTYHEVTWTREELKKYLEQTSLATEDPAAGTHGQALQLPHEGLQARLLIKSWAQ